MPGPSSGEHAKQSKQSTLAGRQMGWRISQMSAMARMSLNVGRSRARAECHRLACARLAATPAQGRTWLRELVTIAGRSLKAKQQGEQKGQRSKEKTLAPQAGERNTKNRCADAQVGKAVLSQTCVIGRPAMWPIAHKTKCQSNSRASHCSCLPASCAAVLQRSSEAVAIDR